MAMDDDDNVLPNAGEGTIVDHIEEYPIISVLAHDNNRPSGMTSSDAVAPDNDSDGRMDPRDADGVILKGIRTPVVSKSST